MKRSNFLIAFLMVIGSTLLPASSAFAAWTGQGEAGIVSASGNTDSENANIGLSFVNDGPVWDHELGFFYLSASTDSEDTAKSFAAEYVAKRDLTERSYLFAGLGYLDDDFDGFTEQSSASIGYGYRVIDTEPVGLELGIGVGYRDTSELFTLDDGTEVEGEDLSSATGVFKMDYRNQFTANTEFTDSFLVEFGSKNTFVQNEAALTVAMNEKFALKAALLIRHNSDAPVGTDDTDTITTVNLVYNF